MARNKRNKLQRKWIILLGIALVFLVGFSLLKNNNSDIVTKEDAVAKVKVLPEVTDYLKRVPNGLILVNGEENDAYLVQVYEFKNGNTATFNWYKVNKTTGTIKKQF